MSTSDEPSRARSPPKPMDLLGRAEVAAGGGSAILRSHERRQWARPCCLAAGCTEIPAAATPCCPLRDTALLTSYCGKPLSESAIV